MLGSLRLPSTAARFAPEAHVHQPVPFVKDQCLQPADCLAAERALLQEVVQATRGGHQDVRRLIPQAIGICLHIGAAHNRLQGVWSVEKLANSMQGELLHTSLGWQCLADCFIFL